MKEKRKKKKNLLDRAMAYMHMRGYTDRLYVLNFLCVMMITAASLVILFFNVIRDGGDMSGVSTLLTVAWAELGTHTGFIIWKAERENMKKFNKDKDKGGEQDAEEDTEGEADE